MRRFATEQIPQQNGVYAQDWILSDNDQSPSSFAGPIPLQRQIVRSHYQHVPSQRSPEILSAVALQTPTTNEAPTLRVPRHRREEDNCSATTARTSDSASGHSGHFGQFGRYRSSRTVSTPWPLMRSQVAPRKDRMFFYPSNIVDDSDSDWADEEDEVSAEMHSLNALVCRERDSAKQCAFESTHGMRQFPPSEEFSPQGMVTGGSNSGGQSIFEATKRSLSSRLDPHGQCPCHYQHFASQRRPAILSAVALQTPTTKKAPTLRVPRHRREEESCSATTARTSDPASGRIADSAPVSPMTSGHFGQFDRYRSSRTASARWLSMRSQAPRKDRMFFYPSNIVDDSDSDWADAEDDVNDGGRAQVYSVSYGAAKRSVMPHN